MFIVGKPVPLNDLFRLGRRSQTSDSVSSSPVRPRPVLLKLSSAWDRRLILSAVRKLRGYAIKRLFIREDLSPEDRQKRRESARAHGLPAVNSGSGQVEASVINQVQSPVSPADMSSVNGAES